MWDRSMSRCRSMGRHRTGWECEQTQTWDRSVSRHTLFDQVWVQSREEEHGWRQGQTQNMSSRLGGGPWNRDGGKHGGGTVVHREQEHLRGGPGVGAGMGTDAGQKHM